jgi:hypothetical protein
MKTMTDGRWAVLAVLILGLIGQAAQAGEPTSTALRRARQLCDFDVKAQSGREILSALHFGAKMVSCKSIGIAKKITDDSGREIYDQFALAYRWKWDAGGGVGTTDVVFYFKTDTGQFVDLAVDKTDAEFNQPFALANLSIALVGEVLYEAMKDDMTDADKRIFRALIDRADTKALLEWSLRFKQLAKS